MLDMTSVLEIVVSEREITIYVAGRYAKTLYTWPQVFAYCGSMGMAHVLVHYFIGDLT